MSKLFDLIIFFFSSFIQFSVIGRRMFLAVVLRSMLSRLRFPARMCCTWGVLKFGGSRPFVMCRVLMPLIYICKVLSERFFWSSQARKRLVCRSGSGSTIASPASCRQRSSMFLAVLYELQVCLHRAKFADFASCAFASCGMLR